MNPTEIEAALEGILKATGGAGACGCGLTCASRHELVTPIFFSVLAHYLTFLTLVKQMHVVDTLGTVFP